MIATTNKETPLKFQLKQPNDLENSQMILLPTGMKINLHELNKREDHIEATLCIFLDHWEVVKQTLPKIKSVKQQGLGRNISDPRAIQEQIHRIVGYLPPNKSLRLNAQKFYVSQRNKSGQIHRTSNTSASAIYLDWLMRATGKANGLGQLGNGNLNDNSYLRQVAQFGGTISHSVQTKAIKALGYDTKWVSDRNFSFIIDLLTTGFPVVVNILHRGSDEFPSGGHVICLIGFNHGVFLVHDPFGTLESEYKDNNGRSIKMHQNTFKKRWQGGYRILA